jgi:hypothetical protein
LTRAVCLHAQQATEKGLKAALVFLQIDFPRTHNLKRLARLLTKDWELPADDDLDWLTTWATASRYPDAMADAHGLTLEEPPSSPSDPRRHHKRPSAGRILAVMLSRGTTFPSRACSELVGCGA